MDELYIHIRKYFTSELKFPTGPERHHSYCPRSNRNREEAVLKRWKWSGVEHFHSEAFINGKGKAALPCTVVTNACMAVPPVCVCQTWKRTEIKGEQLWLCVAGQCSRRCVKSQTDQDKLSHSNKLHIPALIWPKLLDNIKIQSA